MSILADRDVGLYLPHNVSRCGCHMRSRWAVTRASRPSTDTEPESGMAESAASAVTDPTKVVRIATMAKQLLEEVRAAPLDQAGQVRLRGILNSSLRELSEGLSPDLRAELDRITLPLDEHAAPTDSELRIAQAQLVGWLEGLFHGVQAALVITQASALQELQSLRRQAAVNEADNQARAEANAYL